MNVIECRGLSMRYRRAWALRDCSLGIPAGHVVALAGPNGAGKTTLLSIAAGLLRPSAGDIAVLGGQQPGSAAARNDIGFVAQDAPLYGHLAVRGMLSLAANLNVSWDRDRALARVAELHIPLGRKVRSLSGGQRAQLALTFAVVCQLLAVLAGVFLGAPTVAREIENGTARFAWTQAASRRRWLLTQVGPFACLLAAAALGLGAEFGWWLAPFPSPASAGVGPWSPLLFNLNSIVLAGWVLFALTLGVGLGAAIRRTMPAMAATFACYAALWYAVSASWRMHYLAPVHRSLHIQFQGVGRYYSYGYFWPGRPVIMSETLGWPDGRLLSNAEQLRPASWLTLHHIVLWVTYQPASRYHVFQLIEVGWLIAASALLLGAAIVLTRRSRA